MTKKEKIDLRKLTPGSLEAREKGCKCPVLDNKDMPDDLKIVSSLCKIHWKEFFPKEKKKD